MLPIHVHGHTRGMLHNIINSSKVQVHRIIYVEKTCDDASGVRLFRGVSGCNSGRSARAHLTEEKEIPGFYLVGGSRSFR